MRKIISYILAAGMMLAAAQGINLSAAAEDVDACLINIGEGMTFERNRGTWNMNWTSGSGVVEYADYTRTMETAAYVSEDKSSLIIPQTVSSWYQQRFLISSPNEIALDKPVTIEIKFKVKTDDYENAPEVQMFFIGLGEVRTPSLELSEEMADTERTLKYVIDPDALTVTGYLDGVSFKTVPYTYSESISGTWGVYVHAQNKGSAPVEKEELASPVTWTYSSFKVTKPIDPDATPTPIPELPDDDPEYADPGEEDNDGLITRKLVDIENNMKLNGAMLAETGAFEYINWTGAEIDYSLNDNIFKIHQTKGSKWNQRLRLTTPSEIALDSKTVFKMRFKCTADNYNVTLPRAQIMFDSNGVTAYVMQMNSPISVLSPVKKDVWRTLLYTIDPDKGIITGTLDGEEVCQAQMKENVNVVTQPAFELAVNESDNSSMTTPVTWQIGKIEVYQRREPEAPAEKLDTAVTRGEWESAEYANGCGADDSSQLTGAELDLGKKYIINKVTVDQDASDIMSWSIMTSIDGVNYTRVSDVYAGGTENRNGKHIIRFAPREARYVKYSCVLIGNHYTKARMNSIKAEYTEATKLQLVNLPSVINPTEDSRIVLSTRVTEDEDEYIVSKGIKYSVSGNGASIDGNTLLLASDASGEITVTAEDLTSNVSASGVIKAANHPAVNNFVLCSDADYTSPFVNGNGEAYIKAELRACGIEENNDIMLIAASYNKDGVMTSAKIAKAVAANGNEVSVRFMPAQGSAYVKAYILDTRLTPLCECVSSDENGVSTRNLAVPKNTVAVVNINSENIEWVSDDESIASVSGSSVNAHRAGTTTIRAYSSGEQVAKTTVKVVPTAYVFLMMGQSNMSGTNNPVAEGYEELPVSDNVMLFNSDNVFEHATHKYSRYSQITWSEYYHDYDGGAGLKYGINMGYSFAEDWAADNPNSTIGLIVNSQAGCSIDIYEKNTTDPKANGYANTIERVNAALEAGGELAGIIWHQGESNMNRPEYHARLRNMLYDFRLAFNAPEVPFINGGLSEDNIGAGPHNIKSAQQVDYIAAYGFASSTEPSMIPSRHATGCYSGNDDDYVHFSAKGQIEFGHRYYDAYKRVLNNSEQ